jgi:hypothetical protein
MRIDRLSTLMSIAVVMALLALASSIAYAQGGATSTLSGTVTDASGAVIPGADVKVKNNATAAESTTVTADNGTFTIPALNAGTYTVTVSLMGFKTIVLNAVVLNAGVPSSVRASLEVGGLAEVITVQGGSDVVQTASATVSTTMNVNQISRLPLTSRNALDFVVNLPGTNTPGGSRDSTVNGLPQSTINMTLDGMSIQDNYLKTTDGFFARLSPRLDAVEEVTVTSAANGADSAGQGAVNIRFTTRSGTNNLLGSTYFYLRHDGLNANTWFNNRDLTPDPKTGKAPRNALRQYQPGTRVGGPIMIPGVFDGRDKAFFFVNYEENRTPSKGTLTRTILSPAAQQGLFQYTRGSSVETVNLYTLAANNGHIATPDPTVAKLLTDIRNATTTTGQVTTLSDRLLNQYVFQTPTSGFTPAPTVRLDYNLTQKHRLTGSFNYQHINSNPDTTNSQQIAFPGFPIYGSQQSTRYTTSEAVRSTLSPNLVNELRVGATGGATFFSPEKARSMWGGTSVADQGGFHLALSGCCGNNTAQLQNAGVTPTPSSREASTKNIENTLTWIRGTHSLGIGGAFTQADLWLRNQTLVPTINFGIATGDPAAGMFNQTNFPQATNAQLTNARALYSILVGRVSSIGGNARLNVNNDEYEYLGQGLQQGRMRELGFFVQDNWRWKPNLTVNAGLRYELQRPFYALNNSYATATMADVCGVSGIGPDGVCNVFQHGNLRGQKPTFKAFPEGTYAYKTDWNNFAPTLGMSWVPGGRGGFLGRIIGQEGDTVLRAGYSLAYERHGMSDFSDVFGTNPGIQVSANRDTATGTLLQDGLGFPVLLRDRGRLGPPNSIPRTQKYPFTEVITGDLNIFDENLQVPYSQTWTASVGRKLTRSIGIDVRYVGARHLQGWIDYNYNEANILENGFLNEFRLAQANLRANVAAGRSADGFKFTGIPGTSPLPIYLGYLVGSRDVNNPAAYTGTAWTNSDWTNPLAIRNPNPFTPAGTNSNTGLDGDPARRTNAANAGFAPNFFRANPDLQGGVFLTGNGGYYRYDSAQLELRKRMSNGFEFQTSYVFGNAYSTSRPSLRTPRYKVLQTGADGGVTHAWKANWVWELPFGTSRKFLANSGGFLDRLVGGWEFDGIVRIQSGRMLDFGDVNIVGMSAKDLQKAVGVYTYKIDGLSSSAVDALYLLPKDIIENTIRAFNVNATSSSGYGSLGAPAGRYIAPANGPNCIAVTPGSGECGVRTLVLTGPLYSRWDLSAVKRVRIAGRANFEFRAEMLNAFNHPNFTPVISTSTNSDNYRMTGLQENSSRIVQFVWRLNW